MSELAAVRTAIGEIGRARDDTDDLELAYQIQMKEVLEASSRAALLPQPTAEESGIQPIDGLETYRHSLGMQGGELRRAKQVVQDQVMAEDAFNGAKSAMVRVSHDNQVAQWLEGVPAAQWEDEGDLLEAPIDAKPEQARMCLRFDGSAIPNPGPGGYGAVIFTPTGDIVWYESKHIGRTTNNQAEYQGLIAGLKACVRLGFQAVDAEGDSELVVKQVLGQYSTRDPALQTLLAEVVSVKRPLTAFTIKHIRREQNEMADRLANAAARSQPEAEDDQRAAKRSRLADARESTVADRRGGAADPDVEELLPCSICLENVPKSSIHVVGSCLHHFCVDCLEQQIMQHIQSRRFPVMCPEPQCGQQISTSECGVLLDSENAVTQLSKLEVEHSIPLSERFYCPFPTCSALMIVDPGLGSEGDAPSAECMECHRLVCVACKSPWHSGFSCEAYQQLNPDRRAAEDQQLFQLANNEKWRRCARCGHMIELNTGCNHITCQCGYEFCYVCGMEWEGGRAGCQCPLWDERNLMTERERARAMRQDRRMVNPRYKTRMCRHLESRGHCRFGNNCNFAHSVEELDLHPFH